MIINKSDIRLEIPITPKDKIVSLIAKLKPYYTNIELIRLGSKSDGGYLVPNDLEDIKACFSPGVDQVSEFENDCYERGMKLFLADKSVIKPNLSLPQDNYSFLKKFVGCTTNEDFITMDEWVDKSKIDEKSDLLLQMDIEGGEYFTLINTSDSLMKQFRIIVIEFHNLQLFWNHEFFKMNETIFNKILQTHTCVHIHPNNCCGMDTRLDVDIPRVAEFTFLRNDRIKQKSLQKNFPHKLDYDNTANPHLALPKNWYN
ncbi:MAG: FkbM family methyltransferase [Algibacter sp.]